MTAVLAPEQVREFEDLTTRLEGRRLAIVAGRGGLSAPTIAAPIAAGVVEVPSADEAAAWALLARLAG